MFAFLKRVVQFTAVAGLHIPLFAQGLQVIPDPGCETYQAWQMQVNPRADATGKNNNYLTDTNATYWGTALYRRIGASLTISGRYPAARYFSIGVYNSNQQYLDSLRDVEINPDTGQNNPYRAGTAQGTYTLTLTFGNAPSNRPPNSIYTNGWANVKLVYRVYYSNDPNNLPGEPLVSLQPSVYQAPVLPMIVDSGTTLTSCLPRPVIVPQTATVWGRLDRTNFTGASAIALQMHNPPVWTASSIDGSFQPLFSPNNGYLSTYISRKYLSPPYTNNMVVIRMRAPTFPDTQAGDPMSKNAQVHYWSVCTAEYKTWWPVRCVPDDAALNVNGFVTFVISDPSYRPGSDVLSRWGAVWIAWGALNPGDSLTNSNGSTLTNADGVFYNDSVVYRQTAADPGFAQSIWNVSQLPAGSQQGAMGDYWPTIGYCSMADFQNLGAGCVH